MLVALTGASGFVGSYTARALQAAGHTVRALVRPTSRRDHIAPAVGEWVEGDQGDAAAQDKLVAGVDAVIHNVADWSHMQRAVDISVHNVTASIRLLAAAHQAGVKQFLFVSSVAVYHDILHDRPLDENHPAWPNGGYGAYKAAVELFLRVFHHQHGMNTSAWRPAAIYGLDPNRERSQWYKLIKAAAAGEAIDTPQGGKITHVQDVADALTLAVGDDAVAGKLFNLVDRYMYWQQAAEFAKEISGSHATIADRKGAGPQNQFDTRAAVAFFERHGNHRALRRGLDGVRTYVTDLLRAL